MPNHPYSRNSILDMYPKLKTIDSNLRSKVAKDLCAVFSGMYPKVRLVYHCPKSSGRKAEHIFVLFHNTVVRDHFCESQDRGSKPLRLVFNYHGGGSPISDSVVRDMQEMINGMGNGAVVFRGPLFEQAESKVSSGGIKRAMRANDRYKPPFSQVGRKRPREDDRDEVKGFLRDLKRVKYEVMQKSLGRGTS